MRMASWFSASSIFSTFSSMALASKSITRSNSVRSTKERLTSASSRTWCQERHSAFVSHLFWTWRNLPQIKLWTQRAVTVRKMLPQFKSRVNGPRWRTSRPRRRRHLTLEVYCPHIVQKLQISCAPSSYPRAVKGGSPSTKQALCLQHMATASVSISGAWRSNTRSTRTSLLTVAEGKLHQPSIKAAQWLLASSTNALATKRCSALSSTTVSLRERLWSRSS